MQALILLALFATPKEAVVLAALAGCLVVALVIQRTVETAAPRADAPHARGRAGWGPARGGAP